MPSRKQKKQMREQPFIRGAKSQASIDHLTELIKQEDAQLRLIAALGVPAFRFIITRDFNGETSILEYECIGYWHRQLFSTTSSQPILNDYLCRIIVFGQRVYNIDIPMAHCESALDILGKPLRFTGDYDKTTTAKASEVILSWLASMIIPPLAIERAAAMKEELHAAVWHPRRMAALLESGGWDAVENLNGE